MSKKIFGNVQLGTAVMIDDFCIVGQPFKGVEDGEVKTVIGDNGVIRSHSVIYAGNQIGDNFQTGHGAFVRELNVIGDNVSIGTKSIVEHHVVIEDGVRIHSQAFVPEYSHLKRNCWIGPNVVMTNARYPLSPHVKEELQGPTIEENAKIGANATLLPGVRIGRNALVGAGSVVTKDVPENAVVAGNPARVISTLDHLPYGG